MKKYLFIVIALLFVTGCGSKNSYEETMKEYAKDYYENYMVYNENVKPEINIEMLDKANKYDMGKLSKCDKNSYVDLEVSNKEVANYEFHMICH